MCNLKYVEVLMTNSCYTHQQHQPAMIAIFQLILIIFTCDLHLKRAMVWVAMTPATCVRSKFGNFVCYLIKFPNVSEIAEELSAALLKDLKKPW